MAAAIVGAALLPACSSSGDIPTPFNKVEAHEYRYAEAASEHLEGAPPSNADSDADAAETFDADRDEDLDGAAPADSGDTGDA